MQRERAFWLRKWWVISAPKNTTSSPRFGFIITPAKIPDVRAGHNLTRLHHQPCPMLRCNHFNTQSLHTQMNGKGNLGGVP
eukprot:2740870-Rhodomonas_salina.4